MNMAVWLERAAGAWPDAQALFHGTTCVADYAGFYAMAQQVAGWLQGQAIGPGARVGLWLGNGPDYLPLLYGIWQAGAAAVPINAKLHAREVAWILENSGAGLCFVDAAASADLTRAVAGASPLQITPLARAGGLRALAECVAGAAPMQCPQPRAGADLAWLFYTSGTTGRPKGVQITHRMLRTMALDYLACVDDVSAQDCAVYSAPMSHGAGLYNIMHVLKGARHVCPASGGFDPDEIFALSAHFQRVHMFAAPTMVKRMTLAAQADGQDGAGLRSVIYGGGPMYVADIEQAVDRFGPIFIQIYGQGECPMAITTLSRAEVADRSHPKWRARLASVGRAQTSAELRIGDATGQPLPPGVVGEIMVRGDAVMPGYWQNPQANAKALLDGWLMTGDMGFLDEDGYLTLQDRSKDLIISGGSNIYPREVEEVVLQHPLVEEVSVVGAPHPDWGEVVVAFVVTTDGQPLDRAALDGHCLAHIARFKRPKEWRHVAALPKNNYGKVLKTTLRQWLADAGQGPDR